MRGRVEYLPSVDILGHKRTQLAHVKYVVLLPQRKRIDIIKAANEHAATLYQLHLPLNVNSQLLGN